MSSDTREISTETFEERHMRILKESGMPNPYPYDYAPDFLDGLRHATTAEMLDEIHYMLRQLKERK